MRSSKVRLSAALILLAVVLSCCATTHPVDFKELRHASELTPNTGLKKDHIPFVFSSGAQNWGRYHQVLLDQVELYHGADNQFGAMSNGDKSDAEQYPQAENVLASFGTLDACKVGISKGAADLLTQLL